MLYEAQLPIMTMVADANYAAECVPSQVDDVLVVTSDMFSFFALARPLRGSVLSECKNEGHVVCGTANIL